jgi:hypothetical protein
MPAQVLQIDQPGQPRGVWGDLAGRILWADQTLADRLDT